MADHCICHIQNRPGRAVILFQPDNRRLRKIFFKIQNIPDIGSPELVDGLVVVSHHTDIPVLLRQQPHQLKLCRIGVLILVHHDILESLLIGIQNLGTVPEQFHRLHNDVIKVKGIVGTQGFLILPVNLCLHGFAEVGRRIPLKRRYTHQFILGRGNDPQQRPFLIDFAVQVETFYRIFHDGFLIIRVINGKGTVIADPVDMAAQNAHTGRVKCGHPDLARTESHQLVHPLTHLSRRLIGECDCQNIPGLHPYFIDQVCNAVREHPGLAAARSRQQQQGAFGLPHCFFLFLI